MVNSINLHLGSTVITPGALERLDQTDIPRALLRHARGDWGDLDEHDRRANDEAVGRRLRLLSAYADRNGTKFWVITDADRSATTVLLPEGY